MNSVFLKKALVFTLASSLILSSGINSFAGIEENNPTTSVAVEAIKIDKIVDEMKRIDVNDKDQVSKLLSNFFKQELKVNETSIKSNSVNNVNLKFDTKRTIKLDSKTDVIFQNMDGMGIVTIITDTKDVSSKLMNLATNPTIRNTGTKKFDNYGIAGAVLFSVTQEYGFTIKNPSGRGIVTCDYGRGYIAPGFLSMWTGNVWTNTYTSKVETYGTASWSVPLANIIGININIQSINYTAFTICDPMGEVTSDISYKVN